MKTLKSLLTVGLLLLLSLTVFGSNTEPTDTPTTQIDHMSPEYRFVEAGDTFTVFSIHNEREMVQELRWKQYWQNKHDKLLAVSQQQDVTINIQKAELGNCQDQKKEITTQKTLKEMELAASKQNVKGLKRTVVQWQIIAGVELFLFIATEAIIHSK